MDILFGDFKVVEEGKLVDNPTAEVIKDEIDIVLPDLEDHTLYTMVMYDPDAPARKNNRVYIHYMLYNMDKNGVSDEIFSYISPNPPKNKTHRYYIDIYKQKDEIDKSIIKGNRSDYDLESFIKNNNMKIEYRSGFSYPDILDINFDEKKKKNKNKNKKFVNDSTNMFIPESELLDRERKYCSCVLKVASKQPEEALRSGEYDRSKKEYDPYAVCVASTKTTSDECGMNYDFESLSDDLLRAYVNLMYRSIKEVGITIPADRDFERKTWLDIVYKYKALAK